MKTINVIQGSPEWLAHRATAFNASDAPAMMGISKYKTRSQLLNERATGILPDVDGATQQRFNDGHRFEALARPLAEEIIGDALSPVTGTRDEYSASFDGITFDEDVIFEHKSMNDDLRAILSEHGVTGAELDMQYQVQMEHQLMVSGAKKCLFMATKWGVDGDLIESLYCWYAPNLELRQHIGQGWIQFKKDLAAYVQPEVIEKPIAEAIMQLPAVIINATGGLSVCNLRDITPEFDYFLSGANTVLVTDSDFVNADSTAKFSRITAKTLKLKAKEVVDQIATVSEAVRTLEFYADKFDALGLRLEKLVKSEKEARKLAILSEVRTAYAAHVAALEVETAPIKLNIPSPDFAGAIKGLSKLDSVQNAVDTALANGKIESDAVAKDIRGKMLWIAHYADYVFLFRDLQTIISKPIEDFQLAVITRVDQHKAEEEAKIERIRAEEQAKAEAKVRAEQDAILAAERTKMEAERQALMIAEASKLPPMSTENVGEVMRGIGERVKAEAAQPKVSPAVAQDLARAKAEVAGRPTDEDIVAAIALHFHVSSIKAVTWLLEMDITSVGKRMAIQTQGGQCDERKANL